MFQYLIEKNINLNLSIKNAAELDDATVYFTNLIHESAKLSSPQEVENNISRFRISFEIRQLIRRKRRLRKIWQRTRLPMDKTNFNRAAHLLKSRLKEYKNNSLCSYLRNLSPSNNNEKEMLRLRIHLVYGARQIKAKQLLLRRTSKIHLYRFRFVTLQTKAELKTFLMWLAKCTVRLNHSLLKKL